MWCYINDEHEYVPSWLQDDKGEAGTSKSLRCELNRACVRHVGHPVGNSNDDAGPDDDIAFGKFLISETHFMNKID